VPKIPGVNHLDAVRALEKAGFRIVGQGKHIVMSDGTRIVTIPRQNPVNAFTMGGIARDAGLTVEEFKKLLYRCTPSNNSFDRTRNQRGMSFARLKASLIDCAPVNSGVGRFVVKSNSLITRGQEEPLPLRRKHPCGSPGVCAYC